MPPPTDDIGDSFSILNLQPNASESDIKKAYRKLSLKFHPDKVAKDVDPILAANKFHQLNLAYETLMDPASRAKASQKNKEDAEKKKRQQQYEGKRKAMADELERNEQEFARKKQETAREERDRARQVEELKEAGRRMREQKIKEMEASRSAARSNGPSIPQPTTPADPEPELGPLDLTTRLRFPTINYPLLSGEPSQAEDLVAPSDALSTPLAAALQAQFGPLQNLRFQLPAPGKKKKRELTAYATFDHLRDAWSAVHVGGQMKCDGEVLEDVWIGWAGVPTKKEEQEQGGYLEPERVSWYKSKGISTPSEMDRAEGASVEGSSSSFKPTSQTPSSFVIDAAYESATLQRLRDAERARLAQEILKQEEAA